MPVALIWKNNAVAASTENINRAAPGAAVDGVVLTIGDRILLKNQALPAQNGIYAWSGAATALVRSADADTFGELENAIIAIDGGIENYGTGWEQTAISGVIDVAPNSWTPDGSVNISLASEIVAGIAAFCTQAECDAGASDDKTITPLKLKTSPFAHRTVTQLIGNGSAATFTITHGLATFDVDVSVREATGLRRKIMVEIDAPTTNTTRVLFGTAPAANSYRVTVTRLNV